MLRLFFVSLFLIILSTQNGYAQNDPFLRIEIETKSDEANYRVVPCDDDGIMLFYKTTLREDNYDFWVFVMYNKFMQEAWKKDIPVLNNMQSSMIILQV